MMLVQAGDKLSLLGVAFVVGYITCASVNQVQSLWSQHGQLVQVRQTVIPKLKAQIHCEDARADKASSIARQAIVSANSDSIPVPDAAAIPSDCPHPIIKK